MLWPIKICKECGCLTFGAKRFEQHVQWHLSMGLLLKDIEQKFAEPEPIFDSVAVNKATMRSGRSIYTQL
jgi:hypothetical protein